jgi:2'-5' RNA ligase
MRLFIAVPVRQPGALRFLGESRRVLEATRADVKWVSAGQYHCTVRFLGEVDERRLDELRHAVTHCARATQPIDAELNGVGMFDRGRYPVVIRVDLGDASGQLAALEKRLSSDLAALGFPREKRPFHAHVTLGRARSGRNADALANAIRRLSGSMPCRLDRLTLFESTLTPEGPIYRVVEEAPFRGPFE